MSDHFERLGLPRRFSVDPASVEREYLARSRAVHPDFHQLGSSAEQKASLDQTAALNEAYLALKDPFRRAEYLLTLLGGPTAQAEKNLDQNFLMDMLDMRERIEEARGSGNTTAIRSLETELAGIQKHRIHEIASQFDRFDSLPIDHAERAILLVEIRRGLNAVRTIQSLIRDLNKD